jgi:hypothetical protein
MNLVDNKLSEYLSQMEDQAIAGFIREIVFSLPEEQRRAAIMKHLPEMKLNDAEGDAESDAVNETPEPRIWNVPVCRTGWGSRTIQVVATTEDEAIELAIDEAGDHEFSENNAEYTAPDGAF